MMYLGDKPIKAVLSLLPDEYQELEYIESTGTQYINTGVIPSSNLNTYMDWEWVGNNSTAYSFAFGSRTNHQQQGYGLFIYNAGTDQFGKVAFNYGFADSSFTSETRVRGRHILRIEGGVLYIEDKVVYNFSAQSFTGKYPIIVFSGTNAGAIYSGNAPSKLYNLKLYDSGTLVRDFIPCYRKSDNEIGLYDLVNKVFYTNKGTGTFLKGKNKTTIRYFTVPIKKCVGKNLFDISQANVTIRDDGYFISNTSSIKSFYNLRVSPGKTYYIKATAKGLRQGAIGVSLALSVQPKKNGKYVYETSLLVKLVESVNPYTMSGKFTVPDNVTWVSLQAEMSIIFKDFMINEGGAALPYEPYKEWYEY